MHPQRSITMVLGSAAHTMLMKYSSYCCHVAQTRGQSVAQVLVLPGDMATACQHS